MKKFLVIVTLFLLCTTCGVKNDPEYKSQTGATKTLLIV